MRKWLNVKNIFAVICLGLLTTSVFAADFTPTTTGVYLDRSKLIAQQTELLKNRLAQAQNQFALLQRNVDANVSKGSQSQTSFDIAVARSNIDSINIEISESQQTINRLEKDIQEMENQLNISSVFGIKVAAGSTVDINGLHSELRYQRNLLALEKTRAEYLNALQGIADNTLQLLRNRMAHINIITKERTMMQLKAEQAATESGYQQQQSYWLGQLNNFYTQLNQLDANKQKTAYATLQREIFYANEKLNYTYLQMLIVRYQDQLQQFQIAISHNSSITLLNTVNDQIEVLNKQTLRVNDLLRGRLDIIERHKNFLAQEKNPTATTKTDLEMLTQLSAGYQTLNKNIQELSQSLLTFRSSLDKALQNELSARQRLPGFNARDWLNLGAEIWMVPALTFQIFKSLTTNLTDAIQDFSYIFMALMGLLEVGLLILLSFTNKFLLKITAGMAEHELGHINLKRLLIKTLRRNLLDLFVFGNMVALFSICDVPPQSCGLLINLALVWLVFKAMITIARVCLVESVHDRAGHDVILYYRLKWSFLVGGVITAVTVLIHQLPVVYEVRDLADRLFLSFLLVVSVFLLRSWDILPALILPHIDERRLYLKKIVSLLGFLIPLILLINTTIGLFGFVNLVLTVSWYESIFVVVLVSYLIVRGLLVDSMVFVSNLVIRHVVNGWLWTEALLKPLDKVLRTALFFCTGVILFSLYGWNQQTPVVVFLNNLLHYRIGTLFNTAITLLSLIEVGVIVSILFWAARWTREFVYRLLATRTRDMGLRNSIAIFSQYTVIIVGIFICLRVLGIDFRALAVVAGAFAFGVGLGLRDLFNNFACGFLLLIERPLRVGDTVSIDTYEGEVVHIGGRSVTVRTWDHMDVLVPNTEIFTKSFTNWTGRDHIVRTVVAIKINRHDNPHAVQTLIYEVLAQHKDVLNEPAAEVFLKELNDSLIDFEVRYFINLRLVKSRLAVRSEVLFAIWEAFARHDILPPYPHHEVLLRNADQDEAQKTLNFLSSPIGEVDA